VLEYLCRCRPVSLPSNLIPSHIPRPIPEMIFWISLLLFSLASCWISTFLVVLKSSNFCLVIADLILYSALRLLPLRIFPLDEIGHRPLIVEFFFSWFGFGRFTARNVFFHFVSVLHSSTCRDSLFFFPSIGRISSKSRMYF